MGYEGLLVFTHCTLIQTYYVLGVFFFFFAVSGPSFGRRARVCVWCIMNAFRLLIHQRFRVTFPHNLHVSALPHTGTLTAIHSAERRACYSADYGHTKFAFNCRTSDMNVHNKCTHILAQYICCCCFSVRAVFRSLTGP